MVTALCLAASDNAAANGQTSHQWITLDAVERLPDGELRELVEREDLRAALLSGTMFPDGGYAVGHGYGEAAHWEPFQDRYLLWIRANCDRPYTDDCARHVAFLLGLRSHGMADQWYDSVYMERSKQVDVDGWASGASMDEATDVAFVGAVEPGIVPESFIPYEPLLSLFQAHGEPVDADTLDRAQGLLGIAISYVGLAGQNPDTVARYTAEFPWACTHQDDPFVAGNPGHEAEVVAAYWQATWQRLTGDVDVEPTVIFAFPSLESGYARDPSGMVLAAADVRSRIQLVFSRGLDPATVNGERIHIRRDGVEVPVGLDLFYGHASHVVNVQPEQDWQVDTRYDIEVLPGIASFDGTSATQTQAWDVFTGPTPPAPETSGCGCASPRPAPLGPAWILAALWRRKRPCK